MWQFGFDINIFNTFIRNLLNTVRYVICNINSMLGVFIKEILFATGLQIVSHIFVALLKTTQCLHFNIIHIQAPMPCIPILTNSLGGGEDI